MPYFSFSIYDSDRIFSVSLSGHHRAVIRFLSHPLLKGDPMLLLTSLLILALTQGAGTIQVSG
jgi:hypothetical protein